MDPFNDKSSEIGRRSSLRRSSLRGSLRLSISAHPEEDGNFDYDLAEATVSDGFRPTTQPSLPPPTPSPRSTTPSSSDPDPQQFPVNGESSLERPSSTAKPSRPHDFLTLRHDGSDTEGDPSPSPSGPLSNVPQIRPQSPYRGPSAPSHPYQMYQQRTLSNATSSTVPPVVNQQSYDGPRGPAHPYALYTQNIAPSEDEASEPHIPVGFSNAGTDGSYQRQLGPDGEEAGGLIGPLGHTEELPPYTRYPNQPFAPKTSLEANQGAGPATATVPTSAPAPEQVIAGAGGIGVATQNPEFSATEEDLAPARSRPSVESQHEINTAARDLAEKPSLNKWQRRAKKKLWGIVPYWAICLTLIAVVLIGVILGAVIGTVLSHHSKAPAQDSDDDNGGPYDENTSPTSMPDVQPVPTYPADLKPLDTGCYSFPSFSANQAPQDCFADLSQSAAWSCDMSPWSFLMNISSSYEEVSNNQGYDLTLTAKDASDPYPWGMQPFQLKDPAQLTLVNDVFDNRSGPAWWLKLVYDKTVIVSANDLHANTKRWESPEPFFDPRALHMPEKRADTQPSETCWICTWPETTLEIFIYPNNSAGSIDAPPPALPTPTPTAPAAAKNSSSSYGDKSDTRPPYPKPIKFVERRHPESDNKAYCRQVEIIDNGQKIRNVTYDNKPVEIYITENPSSWKAKYDSYPTSGAVSRSNSLQARDTYQLTQCGCLWWL